MAPILHLVRHAQGFHNLGTEFHTLPDPELTELGQEQCTNLQKSSFVDQSRISLVTASPLTRTLQTAVLTFQPALVNGLCRPAIVALPDTQELTDYPCDTGSDLDVLTKRCTDKKWPVDLSRVQRGWNDKSSNGRYAPSAERFTARAKAARQQIRDLARDLVAAGNSSPEIVLVTHGGYLHYFTEDWDDSDKYLGTGWSNCETRAFVFQAGIDSDDEDAHIIETQESRRGRGKSVQAVDGSEQAQSQTGHLADDKLSEVQSTVEPDSAINAPVAEEISVKA